MLKEEARDPHKVQVAVKYAKKTAMVFKSEERRRVYAKHASLCKDEIVFKMQVLGKPQCQIFYVTELTVTNMFQRKYVREYPDCDSYTHFHTEFSKWLKSKYNDGMPSEDEWKGILEEDKQHDYGAISFAEQEESDNEDEPTDHDDLLNDHSIETSIVSDVMDESASLESENRLSTILYSS